MTGSFPYFSRNGTVLPSEQATVPLASIEYAYGFGVYETIRVNDGVPYFLNEHAERLVESARIIALEHQFTKNFIEESVQALVQKTERETYNLKLLLVGGPTPADANLYVLCLAPFFPDRKLYKNGARCVVYKHERLLPHAKSLNMLGSYLAYREAKRQGTYDALLLNRDGHITEGTRTNFFCIQGRTLISPPEDKILLGVMRRVVLKVASENGFTVEQKDIKPEDFANYDGAFLTSSSSKIMPLSAINAHNFGSLSPALGELIQKTDNFLKTCGGKLG